ncbi:MAG TPA: POTRA domain-containing protein, partial [Rhodothermales bacterium]|nr:POTRA domain-containing protein [Rhodothermales bacterium]
MRFLARGICLLFPLLCVLASRPVQAQDLPTGGTRNPPPIVVDVRFAGNDFFSDDELALQVRTKSNRRFLNLPGFTWWLWLYRLGESGTLGKTVGRALMASGEAPAFLDSTVVMADVERLRLFYRQEGFRDAEVSARVDTSAGGSKARVTFEIHRGAPTYLGEVRYEGIDSLNTAQRQQLVRGSLLRPPRSATGDDLSFHPRNQRYSEPTLLEERRRLLTFLRNQGYAAVSRDSIRAIVFPESTDSFDVAFHINPGPRYRFGSVHFRVEGPEPGAPTRVDTFRVDQDIIPDSDAVITTRIEDEKKLNPLLLVRSLRFQPGDVYDQSRVLATKRRLEGTGIFSFSDISPLAPDSTGSDSLAAPVLPHVIDLTTRQRHNIRFETFALQRSGVFGGSESELGMGLGVTYQNANLFGQGEAFQVGVNGSVAANIDPSRRVSSSVGGHFFSSAQAEVSTSLTYPYLIAPFRGLDNFFDLYDARTQLSLSLLTARRDEFHLVIRGKGSARMRLQLQHSRTKTSYFDILDLTLSNPDTLTGFREDFLNKILGVDTTAAGDTIYVVRDPVQRMQLIQDYTQPQVNSALRYTIRATNVNPLQHDRGYSFENSFEVGGNLLYLLDRFA